MLKFLQLADYRRAKVLPKLFWQHFGKNADKITPDFWQRFAGIAGICGNTKTRQNLINRGFNSSFAAGEKRIFTRCQNSLPKLPKSFFTQPVLCAANNTYYPFRGRYILAALKPRADKNQKKQPPFEAK